MGCTKLGHVHQWPTSGTLVIQRCEVRCNFCRGQAGLKDWKYAWFLRRHVRSVHVKKGKYSKLRVSCEWDESKVQEEDDFKQEESEDDEVEQSTEPADIIIQPLYREQQAQGMILPPFYNPANMNGEPAQFDFNDYHPFPAFGTENPAIENYEDFEYNAVNFHDFLDDATGGHGLQPVPELDADGLPFINDDEAAAALANRGFAAEPLNPLYDESAELSKFFMPKDYFGAPDELTYGNGHLSRLSERPVAEIYQQGSYVDDDTRQRVLGYLCMTHDQFAAEGVPPQQLLTCVHDFACFIAKSIDTDDKPTIGAEGWALPPNPMTY